MTITSFKKNKIACALSTALVISSTVSSLVLSNSALAASTLSYYSGEQSLWNDKTNLGISATLFDVNWDEKFSVGGIEHASLFGVDLGSYGVKLWGETSGNISSSYSAGFNGGNFSLNLPVNVDLLLPDEMARGNTYAINTSAIFGAGAGVTITSPESAYFNMGFGIDVSAELNGKGCAIKCTGNLEIIDIDFNENIDIIDVTVKTDASLTIPFLGLKQKKMPLSSGKLIVPGADVYGGGIEIGTPSFDSTEITRIIDSEITADRGAYGVFTSSITDPLANPFAAINLDLDKVFSKVVPAASFLFGQGINVDPIIAKYETLDIDLVAALAFTQDFEVTTKVMGKITTEQIIDGKSNSITTEQTFEVGKELQFHVAEGNYDQLNVSTKYWLETEVTSKAGLLFSGDIEVEALSFEVDIFGAGFSQDPVYNKRLNIASSSTELYNNSWDMDTGILGEQSDSVVIAEPTTAFPDTISYNNHQINHITGNLTTGVLNNFNPWDVQGLKTTVQIDKGTSVNNYEEINVGNEFNNGGTVVNSGTITGLSYQRKSDQERSGSINIGENGNFINNGTIELKANAAHINNGSTGNFVNKFKASIYSHAADNAMINNQGDFLNQGYMLVNNLDNAVNAKFTNNHMLLIDKTFYNNGSFTNKEAWYWTSKTEKVGLQGIVDIISDSVNDTNGTINNFGRFDIAGNFLNRGRLINNKKQADAPYRPGTGRASSPSHIANYKAMTNSGDIWNLSNFYNKKGATLVNNKDLWNSNNGKLYNQGLLTNNKLFENEGITTNSGTIDNYDEFLNKGTLNISETGLVKNSTSNAVIENTGTINLAGILSNQGTIANNGTIDITSIINSSGEVTSFGILQNEGTLNGSGSINNSGRIDNYGKLTQSNSTLYNNKTATLANYYGGQLSADKTTNKGIVVNRGTVNTKTLHNEAGAGVLNNNNFNVNGNFTNAGLFRNASSFIALNSIESAKTGTSNISSHAVLNIYGSGENETTGIIENTGTINLYETFDNHGRVDNQGVINSKVAFNNKSGAILTTSKRFNVEAGSKFNNSGEVNNSGIFDNKGHMANKGTFTNDGLLLNSGDLTNEFNGKIYSLADNAKIFNNGGNIKNSGYMYIDNLENHINSEFTNQQTLLIDKNFYNNGVFTNTANEPIQVASNEYVFGQGLIDIISDSVNDTQGVITNGGTFKNGGDFKNKGLFVNSGKVTNDGNFTQSATGTLDNQQAGTMTFKNDTLLAGMVVNNGLIAIDDQQLLTMTGNLSGSGTFTGETLLDGTKVNPGNSPGTLTFNGDTSWDNVDLTMEVASAVGGGFDFDSINIFGNLTLLSAFTISFDFLDGLDIASLLDESFNFLNISGDVLDGNNQAINLAEWTIDLMDGWASNWMQGANDSWQLALSYNGITVDPTDVPEPTTLLLFLLAGGALLYRRRDTSANSEPELASLSAQLC